MSTTELIDIVEIVNTSPDLPSCFVISFAQIFGASLAPVRTDDS